MRIIKSIKINGRLGEVVCNFCKKPKNPHFIKADYLVRIQLLKGFSVWVYFCEKSFKTFQLMMKKEKGK